MKLKHQNTFKASKLKNPKLEHRPWINSKFQQTEHTQGAFPSKRRYYFQVSFTESWFPIYWLRKLLVVAVSGVKEVKSWLKCYQQPSPLSMWQWPPCAYDNFGLLLVFLGGVFCCVVLFGWFCFFLPQPDDKEESGEHSQIFHGWLLDDPSHHGALRTHWIHSIHSSPAPTQDNESTIKEGRKKLSKTG